MWLPKGVFTYCTALVLLSLNLASCNESEGIREKVQPQYMESKKTIVHKTAKPGAMVSLATPSLVEISENQKVPVTVELKTTVRSGKMEVDISALDGLQLLTENKRFGFTLNGADTYSIPVDLIAIKQGRYYVNLAVSIDDGETVMMRTLAVIVQAGKVIQVNREQKTQFSLKSSDGSNENIIIMPAQETIK